MLVPTARKVWVDTSTPLLFSSFWVDDAVSLSLSTTPLTFVCLGADKTVVVANSHACGCTLNAQTVVEADTARALRSPESGQSYS